MIQQKTKKRRAVNTPHDALFKACFTSLQDAAGLLRHIVPAELASTVDWSSLALEPTEFVSPQLAASRCDLLFSASLLEPEADSGERLFFYVLVEHQSTSRDDVLLRILGYLQRLWEWHHQHHRQRPLVLPSVVCHAVGGWTAATRLHQLLTPQPRAVPGLDPRHVPDFEPIFYDLSQVDDSTLQRVQVSAACMLIFWVLREYPF
ncbi:MAG: Rpn family recombination-promoting nuclease/putative transposase, partial [Myxococcales bacterium]|nr:Rpn family recombination-promoting nuclease/putative transposase [Myxococcales bacterium]